MKMLGRRPRFVRRAHLETILLDELEACKRRDIRTPWLSLLGRVFVGLWGQDGTEVECSEGHALRLGCW